jgi:hypothetical protein
MYICIYIYIYIYYNIYNGIYNKIFVCHFSNNQFSIFIKRFAHALNLISILLRLLQVRDFYLKA